MNTQNLPDDFIAFPKMIVCGNTLINVPIVFEVKGEVPFLVGGNDTPKIWLKGYTDSNNKILLDLVRANKPLDPSVKVIDADTDNISIIFSNKTILCMNKNDEGIPEIIYLDFHPIGLDISGDTNELQIGTSKLSHNSFTNINTMIGIG